MSPGKWHDLPGLLRESCSTCLYRVFFLAYVLALWLSPIMSPSPYVNFCGLGYFSSFTIFHIQSVIRLYPFYLQIFFRLLLFILHCSLIRSLLSPCHNDCKRFPMDYPLSTLMTLQSFLYLATIVLSLPCHCLIWRPCSLRRFTSLTIIWPLPVFHPSRLSLLQHWTTHWTGSSQHNHGLTFFPLAYAVSYFVNTALWSWLSFLHISRFISAFLSSRKMSLSFSPWKVTCSFSMLLYHSTSRFYIF